MKNSALILFMMLLFGTAYSQKPLKAEEELSKEKVYRSMSEVIGNKRRVFILNLDGKKLNKIPEKVYKLKNLQVLRTKFL